MKQQSQGADWSDLKSKIKTKWAKIPDTELEGLQGKIDNLAGKIQKAYGVPKYQAQQEVDDFKKTLKSK